MNEAKASLNFFGITEKGWHIQVTLRNEEWSELLKDFGNCVVELTKMKVVPDGRSPKRGAVVVQPLDDLNPVENATNVVNPSAPVATNIAKPEVPAQAPADVPVPPKYGLKHGSYIASRIIVKKEEGKRTSFKVVSDVDTEFSKFGVTIYPEVLEAAGLDVVKVSAKPAFELGNATAYWMEYEHGEKIWKKIVRLDISENDIPW